MSGFGQKAEDYVPLNSLAGALSAMKSRGRTISGASDSTLFSSTGAKQKSLIAGAQFSSTLTSPFVASKPSLSPNLVQGKPLTLILIKLAVLSEINCFMF